MGIVYGPKWPFILMYISLDVDWDRFEFGQSSRTKETLPDFL